MSNTSGTPRLSDADLAKVRRRHFDIPQDGLFDPPAAPRAVIKAPKAQRQTSIAWAFCPVCDQGGKRTGLVALDADTMAFRDHNRKIGKLTMPCSGSGMVWDGDVAGSAE